MNFEEFKDIVILIAKKSNIKNYEIYYMQEGTDVISTFQNELESFTSTITGGVCFRCIVNGKAGYASTELFNEQQASHIVLKAFENAQIIESDEIDSIHENTGTYLQSMNQLTPLPKTDELIKCALNCQDIAYKIDNRVVDGTCSHLINYTSTIKINNSKGLDLENSINFTAGYTQAVVEQQNEKFCGFDYVVGDYDQLNFEQMVNNSVNKAISSIGADIAQSGKYMLVIDSNQMINLLSTFASIFSSEYAQKGLSLLYGKEGQRVASDCLTLIDDPNYAHSVIQAPFDAEGISTYKKNVIENGILKTLLYNTKTANHDNKETTGNASKDSYSSNISIAPYNFYIKPGENTIDQLFSKVENGIYVTQIKGTHAGANAITGDFSLESSGFYIKNGKKDSPVKSFTIAGNFFDLLKQIVYIGDDLKFDIPSGYTVYGSPSVAISDISIAGK